MVSALLHLCLVVFFMLNSSQLLCSEFRAAVAWDLEGSSAPSEVTTAEASSTEEGEAVAGAATASGTATGFAEMMMTVEKVSGEDSVGRDRKIVLLEKYFRVLLGLHKSSSKAEGGRRRSHAGFAPAPAPAALLASSSPAPAPLTIHRRGAHRYSHPPYPRPGLIPSLQNPAQAQRRNEAVAVKIVIAVAVSVGATLLIVGLTLALLRRRFGRLNREGLEKKAIFASAAAGMDSGGGGLGLGESGKMSSTHSVSQAQKVSQELFYLNPAMVPPAEAAQASPVYYYKPTANVAADHPRQSNISWRSSPPLSRCRPIMCSAAACSRASQSSSSSGNGNESFHSVCNSGSSTARSSGASNESLLPEHEHHRSHPGLLKSPTTTVDSAHSLPLEAEASPSHHHSNTESPPAQCSSCSSALQQLQPNPTLPPPPPPLPQKILVGGGAHLGKPPPLPPPLPSSSIRAATKLANNTSCKQPPIPPPLPPISPASAKLGNATPKPPPPPPLQPSTTTTTISGHPPPAPPSQLQCHVPTGTGKDGSPLPKLKPLHWDKVRAAPERLMVWDKIRSNSFELDEEMIESLFSYNLQSSSKTEESIGKNSSPSKHVLEPKRLQNFTILLKALNATADQVCQALIQGTGLCARQLEALSKIATTKDEERKLLAFEADNNELGPAEKFVKAILTVPFSFSRIEAMLFKETFKDEVLYLGSSFQMLEEACQELRSSHLFMRLLEAVLKTGNRMNVGTIRGGARAFKLDALLKLADVKGTDGKTTLLHFVVQEVIRSEGASAIETNTNRNSPEDDDKNAEENEENYRKKGLELVSGLSSELCNVKKTAGIDLDTIVGSVSNLSDGIIKLKNLIGNESLKEDRNGGFVGEMSSFRNEAEVIIKRLKEEEDRVLLHVKETTEYFHGDVSKEEANPLRIFVIVRDFLGMLDQVCKELTSAKTRHSPNRVIHF